VWFVVGMTRRSLSSYPAEIRGDCSAIAEVRRISSGRPLRHELCGSQKGFRIARELMSADGERGAEGEQHEDRDETAVRTGRDTDARAHPTLAPHEQVS
jgi:hypothetical protein